MLNSAQHNYQGKLLLNESMKKYNSWRVGGAAEKLFKPASREDLQSYLSDHSGEDITFIGLGSNVLIRDGGIKGTVVVLTNQLDDLKINGQEVYAEAGVPCAKLAKKVAKAGLVGAEFFAGIPGTVGGALSMNAGAWGGETWPNVSSVETINQYGEIHVTQQDKVEYGYRMVNGFEGQWFLSALFKFEKGDIETSEKHIKELLNERAIRQPTGVNSCGSVFTNPEGGYAAKLVQEAGLKGYRIGGACVSEKHANFIINDNNASADDIESLISYVQKTVEEKSGVRLHTEVRMLGDKA